MQFIHKKIRLNASLNKVMRFFKNEFINDFNNEFNFKLIQEDFEKLLKYEYTICIKDVKILGSIDIYFMKCTSQTKYCTQVNFVIKSSDNMNYDILDNYFNGQLKQIRYHFNKDWIIQDEDLNLSILSGGVI